MPTTQQGFAFPAITVSKSLWHFVVLGPEQTSSSSKTCRTIQSGVHALPSSAKGLSQGKQLGRIHKRSRRRLTVKIAVIFIAAVLRSLGRTSRILMAFLEACMRNDNQSSGAAAIFQHRFCQTSRLCTGQGLPYHILSQAHLKSLYDTTSRWHPLWRMW